VHLPRKISLFQKWTPMQNGSASCGERIPPPRRGTEGRAGIGWGERAAKEVMTRPIGTAEELERRGRRAVSLLERGETPMTVALLVGVHENSVHRWRRMAQSAEGLSAKPHFGPPPRLSERQVRQLEQLLHQGAHRHGWPNARWTVARVTELIQR